jgi:hypothetical protein
MERIVQIMLLAAISFAATFPVVLITGSSSIGMGVGLIGAWMVSRQLQAQQRRAARK